MISIKDESLLGFIERELGLMVYDANSHQVWTYTGREPDVRDGWELTTMACSQCGRHPEVIIYSTPVAVLGVNVTTAVEMLCNVHAPTCTPEEFINGRS